MQRDDKVYVGHMIDTGKQAMSLLGARSRADFDADLALRLALTHLLQRLGEAARHVSASFCEAHPSVPWQQIVGMRHRVVHDYMNVDEDVVWVTVTRDLPGLVEQLQKIFPDS